ncbi:MAG TPA: hypothetical protein VHQ86_04340 [Candidatus Saccharimonadia bacterium]|jgi:hypothetical protein|nr:hypothetical protein [Candidatus Saccharimonadia bacterium]
MKHSGLTVSPAMRFGLAYFILSFGFTMLVYVLVQQNYRQSANDPQIQLAEDGATALEKGVGPIEIIGPGHVEMGSSLAPFVTVFDQNHAAVASNGQFKGQTLVPPSGTFDFAKTHGQDRFTWEPQVGVREAAVLVYNGGLHPGYVLAARNLREVEIRENQAQNMVAAALGVLVVAGLVLIMVIK